MSASHAAEVLSLWDRCQALPPARRALALLAPPEDAGPLGDLPVGTRDSLLLRLRERLFGSRLEARADCPRCREPLEFAVPTSALCVGDPSVPPDPASPLACECEGWTAELRVPRCADLELAAGAADGDAARRVLLERCLLGLRRPDRGPATLDDAPSSLLDVLVTRLAEADPAADLRLELTCPSCQACWVAPFDVAAFLWTEIRASASRLVREVHELARAYGWSEASILNLSSARRQAYLELARA